MSFLGLSVSALLPTVLCAGAAPLVGIMYEGWHAPAVQAIEDCTGCAPPLTVEAVLRSNSTQSLSDAYATADTNVAQGFHFHKEPQQGFYCIYRKRATDAHGATGLRDCRDIPGTAARHAAMLSAANISFVVADSTNIQSDTEFGDAIQLRPFEVLAEEWHALRQRGRTTPQIAIWQNLQDPNGTLWQRFVDTRSVYANASYRDLLLRDGRTGRPVFFTTANPDAGLVARLEQEYNVTTQIMWALRDKFADGEIGFFSPCTDDTGAFTTSVPLDNVPGDCAQKHTTGASIGRTGTVLTVSPSYQLSFASLPWRASGKLGGATLKAQFATAWGEALRGRLDFLFLGTFNEHIAQPQPNPFVAAHPRALSQGLGDSGPGGAPDAHASSLWVDMYGDSISRDLEPTSEDGGAMWELLLSCLRVLAAGEGCAGEAEVEACCDTQAPAQRWRAVWVLKAPAGQGGASRDLLHTVDAMEYDELKHQGWIEQCAPLGGAAAFCGGSGGGSYQRGPFLLHAVAQPAPAAPSRPVYRCITPPGTVQRHFLAGDPACYGGGVQESLIGFASSTRDSTTPRSLRSCATPQGAAFAYMYHSLDSLCSPGDEQLAHIGYVH